MSTIGDRNRSRVTLTLSTRSATRQVSTELYGLFIEDINHACDGGLNANLVNNHSFEGVYAAPGSTPFASRELIAEIGEAAAAQLVALTPAGRVRDHARHWTVDGGRLEISDAGALADGSHFARISSRGSATVENRGYPGEGRNMPLTGPLHFTAWVRGDDYAGELEVRVIDADGATLDSATIASPAAGWAQISARLSPRESVRGALQLVLRGTGTLDVDELSLVRDDHWGAGDPRWSQGLLRRDLVEMLQALAPRFIRFPGGCLVEGCGDGSHYRWKETLGPIETRRAEYNMWGQFVENGDYSQSNQIGFYEYFLLCEDLGAEPVPVVWAGVSCQVRTDASLPIDSEEFAEVVQDAVDLIDWATGDPATSQWAALRAQAGHPEPFALNYIGIGNENHGAAYRARFELIREAVERRRPGMSIIISTSSPDAPDTADTWAHARSLGERLIVDEHFYYAPDWMVGAATRYDDYPRDTARVFIGEWSAFPPHVIGPDRRQVSTVDVGSDPEHPNTWATAVAEAAFLTGVERNADVVALVSYAPLLNMAEHGQWAHNLIDFSPTDVVPTVNYLVQRLFSTNIGRRIVPIESTLPARVFASATTDDATTFLKLVNADSAPVAIDLDIDVAADGPAPATRLHGPLAAVNLLPFDGPSDIRMQPEDFAVEVVGGRSALSLDPASVVVIRLPK